MCGEKVPRVRCDMCNMICDVRAVWYLDHITRVGNGVVVEIAKKNGRHIATHLNEIILNDIKLAFILKDDAFFETKTENTSTPQIHTIHHTSHITHHTPHTSHIIHQVLHSLHTHLVEFHNSVW